ncbi:MAG: leucine-rich repeat domain-containing protein [archaeon]|nr:leucine-rich repeat domain-containing protein [archaeon]
MLTIIGVVIVMFASFVVIDYDSDLSDADDSSEKYKVVLDPGQIKATYPDGASSMRLSYSGKSLPVGTELTMEINLNDSSKYSVIDVYSGDGSHTLLKHDVTSYVLDQNIILELGMVDIPVYGDSLHGHGTYILNDEPYILNNLFKCAVLQNIIDSNELGVFEVPAYICVDSDGVQKAVYYDSDTYRPIEGCTTYAVSEIGRGINEEWSVLGFAESYSIGSSLYGKTTAQGVVISSTVLKINDYALSIKQYDSKYHFDYGFDSVLFNAGSHCIYIGNEAFRVNSYLEDQMGLKSLVLPDSLQYIGSLAFMYCHFSSIDIPDSVTYLGDRVFNYIEELEHINIGTESQLKHIEGHIAVGCKVNSIYLPAGLIGNDVVVNNETYHNVLVSPLPTKGTPVTIFLDSNSFDYFYETFSYNPDVVILYSAEQEIRELELLGTSNTKINYGMYLKDGEERVKILHSEITDNLKAYFVSDVLDLEILSSITNDVLSFKLISTVHNLDVFIGDEKMPRPSDGEYICPFSSDTLLVFVRVSTHEVSFEVNGAIVSRELVADSSCIVNWPEDPVLRGHIFRFWSVNNTPLAKDCSVVSDMRIVAVFEETDTLAVTIISDTGNVALVTGNIVDGRTLAGTEVVLRYSTPNVVDFHGWYISTYDMADNPVVFYLTAGDSASVMDCVCSSDGTTLTMTVEKDIVIRAVADIISNASQLTPVINAPTATKDLVNAFAFGGVTGTSGGMYVGVVSMPLVIGNNAYVWMSGYIYKVDTETGNILAIAESVDNSAYYYYVLSYIGNGKIVDLYTRTVFDEDLNYIQKLPSELNSLMTIVYNDRDGFAYAFTGGSLLKYDTSGNAFSMIWDCSGVGALHNNWGVITRPVFFNDSVYWLSATNGDERVLCSVSNLSSQTPVFSRLVLDKVSGYLMDDGWISTYGDSTVFLTSYTKGLFSPSGTYSNGKLVILDLTSSGRVADAEVSYYELPGNTMASEFVVVDNLAFLNIGGDNGYTLNSYEISKNGGRTLISPINSVKTLMTHGSIVVNTHYDSDDVLYLYIVPYSLGGNITVVRYGLTDNSMVVVPLGDKSSQYSSQAIRVDNDGRLVYYNDSGMLFVDVDPQKNVFYFFVQNGNTSYWAEAYGADMRDALNSLDDVLVKGDYISSVDGRSGSYNIYALNMGHTKTDVVYSWSILADLSDKQYFKNHYFAITNLVSAPALDEEWALDGEGFTIPEMLVPIKDLLGKTLTSESEYLHIEVEETEHGTVRVSGTFPNEGDMITITPVADYEYVVGAVNYAVNGTIVPIELIEGAYRFIMPSESVIISVRFDAVPLHQYSYYFDLGGETSSVILGDTQICDYGGIHIGTVDAMNLAEALKKSALVTYGAELILENGNVRFINGMDCYGIEMDSQQNTGNYSDVYASIVYYVLEEGIWSPIENLLTYSGKATTFAVVFQPWSTDTESVVHTFSRDSDNEMYSILRDTYNWAGYGYLGSPYLCPIEVSVSAGGNVQVPDYAVPGSSVTISVEPKQGYYFIISVASGGKDLPVTDGCFIMPSSSVTVNVSFENNTEEYTIVFKNWDGTILSSKDYAYGTSVSDIVKPVAVRADDESYTYVFREWSPAVVDVSDNATYTAVFEASSKQSGGSGISSNSISVASAVFDTERSVLNLSGESSLTLVHFMVFQGENPVSSEGFASVIDGKYSSFIRIEGLPAGIYILKVWGSSSDTTATLAFRVGESSGTETVVPSGTGDEVTVIPADTENAIEVLPEKGTLRIEVTESTGVSVSKSDVEKLNSKDASMEIAMSEGSVLLDKDVLSNIAGKEGSDVKLSLKAVDTYNLDENVKKIIKDSPVFDISLFVGGSNVSILNGTATVTVDHVLKSGENPSKLSVWYISDNGVVEEFACVYNGDGTISFSTTHFSKYAVVYDLEIPGDDPVPGPTPGPEPEPSKGGDNNSMMYIAIGVIIAIVALAGVFFVVRKKA